MALTLSGTNGVVGAGFTLDPSGTSVTAGVGTFGSIKSDGIVQIGGATENSADIDATNTKVTIKQSANAAEDGIYIERSGERRGHYIYVGSGLSQNDALCVRSQQLGTDTDVLAIDRGGDVVIGAGNIIIGTAGKGIDFSNQTATGVSTVTSEVLDHYEEGTWTPDVRGSSNAGAATYTGRYGLYIRIGRLVHVYADIRWSGHSGSGGLEVYGLPFAQNNGGYPGHWGLNYNSGMSYGSGDNQVQYGWANNNSSYIRYWESNASGGSGALTLDTVVGELHIYGHYLTGA